MIHGEPWEAADAGGLHNPKKTRINVNRLARGSIIDWRAGIEITMHTTDEQPGSYSRFHFSAKPD